MYMVRFWNPHIEWKIRDIYFNTTCLKIKLVKYLLTCRCNNNNNNNNNNNTYLLTHSTQHSPSWEAKRFAASQEIPHILWDPKVHYHIHKWPPPVPVLSQLDPVHNPTSHLLKIHLNIILPSTSWYPQWSIYARFLHQTPAHTSPLPHTRYMPHSSHSSRFYHQYNIG
jgi:hypothetical protein